MRFLFAFLLLSSLAMLGAVLGRAVVAGTALPDGLPELFTAGPWPQVISFYVFAVSLTSTLLLTNSLVQRHRLLISTFGLALLGSMLPLAVLATEFLGVSPFARLELLPFALSLCSAGFLYGLFDRRPEELGAIDRHAAVEGMDEGWIVLDVNDTIMDMNAAAERMTGYSRADVFGRPITTLLGDLSDLGLTLSESQEVELKRSIQLEEGWRCATVRVDWVQSTISSIGALRSLANSAVLNVPLASMPSKMPRFPSITAISAFTVFRSKDVRTCSLFIKKRSRL